MTPNDFLKVLMGASNRSMEPVPEGWYTRSDLCKIWNIKRTTCRDRIAAGLKLELIEKKSFNVADVNGLLKPTPHYFFKDEKKICKNKNKR